MGISRDITESNVCPYCLQPDWKCIQTNCEGDEEEEEEEEEEEND